MAFLSSDFPDNLNVFQEFSFISRVHCLHRCTCLFVFCEAGGRSVCLPGTIAFECLIGLPVTQGVDAIKRQKLAEAWINLSLLA